MALISLGGLPAVGQADPMRVPWWWAQIVSTWKRIQGIHEAAAFDPEKMTAPKNFWLDEQKLEKWYEGRERLRKHN